MMKQRSVTALLGLAAFFSIARMADAQTGVTLPDTTRTTTLTAAVAEQVAISLPASVDISVNNVSASNNQPNQSVTLTGIVLSSTTKQLRISLQAAAATFTPPATTTNTWNASDVSWTSPGPATGWTNATGTDGTLSSSAYNTVATCNAGVASCSTTKLKFTLAPKTTIDRSGIYTLLITWKFESIGT